MENDAPELIKKFYKEHPQAPRHILAVTLKQGQFTTGIDHSLPSEQELIRLARKTSNFSTLLPPPRHTQPPRIDNEPLPTKSEITLLPPIPETNPLGIGYSTNPTDTAAPTTQSPKNRTFRHTGTTFPIDQSDLELSARESNHI